jgi:hypothetical protein
MIKNVQNNKIYINAFSKICRISGHEGDGGKVDETSKFEW